MSSNAFAPRPIVLDAAGELIASGPYYCGGEYSLGAGTNSVRALLGAGDYTLGASGFSYDIDDLPEGGAVGPYSLSSTLEPEAVTGCEVVFIGRGVTTEQRIDTTDCATAFQSSTYFSDRFRIRLAAGREYTISTSADFDTYLEVRTEWGETVTFNNDFGGSSNSQITFMPSVSGLYVVRVATQMGDATGTYTLIVQ